MIDCHISLIRGSHSGATYSSMAHTYARTSSSISSILTASFCSSPYSLPSCQSASTCSTVNPLTGSFLIFVILLGSSGERVPESTRLFTYRSSFAFTSPNRLFLSQPFNGLNNWGHASVNRGKKKHLRCWALKCWGWPIPWPATDYVLITNLLIVVVIIVLVYVNKFLIIL